MTNQLAAELKSLVGISVALLGRVLEKELGQKAYARIEKIRKEMATLRGQNPATAFAKLENTFAELEKLTSSDRQNLGLAFALMLEVMNTCENAYRSRQLSKRMRSPPAVTSR